MELIAVVAILGILATAAITRLGQSTLGNLGARGDARRIALDLHQARRRAISTGDNHFVRFQSTGSAVTGYGVYRRQGASETAVESSRQVPAAATVTSSHADAEFNFEGTALAAYQITVAGPDRSWVVSVVPVTGAVRVVESP